MAYFGIVSQKLLTKPTSKRLIKKNTPTINKPKSWAKGHVVKEERTMKENLLSIH